MILVLLGTQKQKMFRLLDQIEKYNFNDVVIVQAGGSSDYKSSKMIIKDFISYEDMNSLIDKADLVITHGGTGSILSALKKGKKVVACPRLSKYNEHVDDHQNEIVNNFVREHYLISYNDGDDFETIIKSVKDFVPKKYISNTMNFIEHLKKEI